ncbi:hypothetical protein PHISCL_03249 [Aspergillus sclerotialis]|uniref:Uncharacterized protein n=1 Tax=Aspergillus sclerotialis TaxID=2070753 RepID=A0A3A3A2Z1_9EURO|nr:hypothetical protein PHISCL_03249 [Aspergillus sclerotialis]
MRLASRFGVAPNRADRTVASFALTDLFVLCARPLLALICARACSRLIGVPGIVPNWWVGDDSVRRGIVFVVEYSLVFVISASGSLGRSGVIRVLETSGAEEADLFGNEVVGTEAGLICGLWILTFASVTASGEREIDSSTLWT